MVVVCDGWCGAAGGANATVMASVACDAPPFSVVSSLCLSLFVPLPSFPTPMPAPAADPAVRAAAVLLLFLLSHNAVPCPALPAPAAPVCVCCTLRTAYFSLSALCGRPACVSSRPPPVNPVINTRTPQTIPSRRSAHAPRSPPETYRTVTPTIAWLRHVLENTGETEDIMPLREGCRENR